MNSADIAEAKNSNGNGGASPPRPGNRTSWFRLALPVGGALVTGAVVAVALSAGSPSDGTSELSLVSVAQIEDAARTLAPSSAAQIAADAKACKAPMAYVTLSADSSAAPTVRVRSGSYLSPAIVLTNAPQRVAIPFPAPYLTGRGVLSVEGQGKGVAMALTPVWKTDVPGTATINVTWTPKNAC